MSERYLIGVDMGTMLTKARIFDGLAEASKSSIQVEDKIEPREEYHEFYKPYVDFYSTLLENLGGFYSDLADLPQNV